MTWLSSVRQTERREDINDMIFKLNALKDMLENDKFDELIENAEKLEQQL